MRDYINGILGIQTILNVRALQAKGAYGFWALFSSPCWFIICFRTAALFQMCPPLVAEVVPAVGLVAYSIWGLGPTTRMLRQIVFKVVWSILILAVSFLQCPLGLLNFFSYPWKSFCGVSFMCRPLTACERHLFVLQCLL